MKHPLLIEINTRCWLHELPLLGGRECTLASVPDWVLGEWAETGLTHVWLMGVWTTGPRSRSRALSNPALRDLFSRALPGWSEQDVVGSPYAIAAYELPEVLGGIDGLQTFRRQLHRHGLKLVLDFVPNHVGLDHPWVVSNPDYFVQSPPDHPYAFRCETRLGTRWLVHGKDPHFQPWDDTVQLDYRQAAVRSAMQAELLRIAGFCDGVRCDMAMLLLREVSERNWQDFPPAESGSPGPEGEFWSDAIAGVRARHPGLLFLAEVYWGLEARLQELGFDYTYDKCLTDVLLSGGAVEVVRHLQSKPGSFICRSAHFIENHDEERVAALLDPGAHRAAALVALGLPGLRLLHDGQMAGATLRTPVQLGRRMPTPVNPVVHAMYARLLAALRTAGVGEGEGRVLQTQPAWADNPTWENLVVIRWGAPDPSFALVVVNLAKHRSQCRVSLDPLPAGPTGWELVDLLGVERWRRTSSELRSPGLFLDVVSHGAQLFLFQPDASVAAPKMAG